MVRSLDYIININHIVADANRVSFKYLACLFLGQATTLNVVGVVGHINLRAVINSALQPHLLLLTQDVEQRSFDAPLSLCWRLRIAWNIPTLANKICPLNAPRSAIVAHRALGNLPFFRELFN